MRLMVVVGCGISLTHGIEMLLNYALHVAHICLKSMCQIKVEYLK